MSHSQAAQGQAQVQAQGQQQVEVIQAVTFTDLATFLEQERRIAEERSKAEREQHEERLKIQRETADRQREAAQRQEADVQAKQVPMCDGATPASVREWMKEIELTIPYTDRTVYVAQRTAKGRLRGALESYLAHDVPDRNAVTWRQLKKHLSGAFLSPDEDARLRHDLSQVVRGTYETVMSYGGRFKEAANLAYPVGPGGIRSPAENRLLLQAYLNGLNNQKLLDRMMEEIHPETYEQAMEDIDTYETKKYRYKMSLDGKVQRQEEPMEIGAISTPSLRPSAPEYVPQAHSAHMDLSKFDQKLDQRTGDLERKINGMASQLTKLYAIMERQATSSAPLTHSTTTSKQQYDYQYTEEGRPICHYCKKPNHIAKECRTRLRDRQGRRPSQQDRGGQ
jgi:hypothetical protein